MHRKQHRRLRKKFVSSRDPLGDSAYCKWDFIQNGAMNIPPSTTCAYKYLDFSDLSAVIAAFQPSITSSENILPPGLFTWLNGYRNYRVMGCAVNFEVINEGYILPTASTANQTQPYTPYAAVSFEGPAVTTSMTDPGATAINTASYWLPAAIQQQRWAKWKIMAAPGASRQITSVKQYCSTYHLSPDKVPNNLSTYGWVIPQTAVPPDEPNAIPAPGTPPLATNGQSGRYVGWGVGNWNGSPNGGTIQTNFTYRLKLKLYVKLFNKIQNTGVW